MTSKPVGGGPEKTRILRDAKVLYAHRARRLQRKGVEEPKLDQFVVQLAKLLRGDPPSELEAVTPAYRPFLTEWVNVQRTQAELPGDAPDDLRRSLRGVERELIVGVAQLGEAAKLTFTGDYGMSGLFGHLPIFDQWPSLKNQSARSAILAIRQDLLQAAEDPRYRFNIGPAAAALARSLERCCELPRDLQAISRILRSAEESIDTAGDWQAKRQALKASLTQMAEVCEVLAWRPAEIRRGALKAFVPERCGFISAGPMKGALYVAGSVGEPSTSFGASHQITPSGEVRGGGPSDQNLVIYFHEGRVIAESWQNPLEGERAQRPLTGAERLLLGARIQGWANEFLSHVDGKNVTDHLKATVTTDISAEQDAVRKLLDVCLKSVPWDED